MDKRKPISKSRIIKSKLDLSKAGPHTDSSSKLAKIGITDSLRKNATPTRIKSKNILNKRTSETPKPKTDDYEEKRKSVPNTQENAESYYNSYIKALSQKLEKQKTQNDEIESELRLMEQAFHLEEKSLKQDIEKLLAENKKLKKEKYKQEAELMEENFKIRKDFEDFKMGVGNVVNDVIGILQGFDGGNWENLASEVVEKIQELIAAEDSLGPRYSLKGTASFSNIVHEVFSDKESDCSGFKEAIVLHPFEASMCEELSLKVGDRVMVISSDIESSWWIGKIGENIGRFPQTCVMLD